MNFDLWQPQINRPFDLEASLAELETERLVQQLVEPELAYLFRHALMQDTAYASLLRQDRKRLHHSIAKALEEMYPARLDEFASRLAQHYAEAGDDAKSIEYAIRAGDVAARLYANPEADLHYSHAIAVLAREADTDENRRLEIDTLVKQVSVSILFEHVDRTTNRLAQAQALLNRLPEGGQGPQDQRRAAQVHYWLGRAYVFKSQMREAVSAFQQVVAVAQELGDDQLLAIPYSALGRVSNIQGQFSKAAPLLTRAVTLLERAGNWSDWTFAMVHLGLAQAAQGDYAEGLANGRRALARALEFNNPVQISETQTVLGLIYYIGADWRGLLQAAEATIQAGASSGTRVFLYAGHAERAYAESRMGDHDAARADMLTFKELSHEFSPQISYADWYAAAEAQIVLRAGDVEEALVVAQRGAELSQSMQALFGGAISQRVWGQALVLLDPPCYDEAEAHFAESLRMFEEGDARLEAARTQVEWGKLLDARGNGDGAREQYQKAAAQFQASGLESELAETLALMGNSTK